jgi:hypothetical protein
MTAVIMRVLRLESGQLVKNEEFLRFAAHLPMDHLLARLLPHRAHLGVQENGGVPILPLLSTLLSYRRGATLMPEWYNNLMRAASNTTVCRLRHLPHSRPHTQPPRPLPFQDASFST